MVQYIPPPDARSLLPPLLACLPTAFASHRPPPALLPILSPILRQRVQLLATTATSSTESWLPLLCWESEPAQRLVDVVVESDAFELHPISGEIECGSIKPLRYRRLDEETLQARIDASEMGLTVIILWCQGDQEQRANGWLVAEVRPLEKEEDVKTDLWYPSMTEAEEQAYQKAFEDAIRDENETHTAMNAEEGSNKKNDEDDYWAQYDSAPNTGPEAGQSFDPSRSMNQDQHAQTTSEAEYFARYAQVQPEMDNGDPSEERAGVGDSTLNGHGTASNVQIMHRTEQDASLPSGINQPNAILPPSDPATIPRLEQLAESQFPTHLTVRRHISTSIKSLFRLCKGTGIERLDFEEIVRTELETLSIIEEEG